MGPGFPGARPAVRPQCLVSARDRGAGRRRRPDRRGRPPPRRARPLRDAGGVLDPERRAPRRRGRHRPAPRGNVPRPARHRQPPVDRDDLGPGACRLFRAGRHARSHVARPGGLVARHRAGLRPRVGDAVAGVAGRRPFGRPLRLPRGRERARQRADRRRAASASRVRTAGASAALRAGRRRGAGSAPRLGDLPAGLPRRRAGRAAARRRGAGSGETARRSRPLRG